MATKREREDDSDIDMAPAPKTSPPDSLEFGRTVSINVGQATSCAASFVVHRHILATSAPCFDDRINNATVPEEEDFVIDLPNESPETFNTFVGWAYTGSLPRAPSPGRSSNIWIDLYVFAVNISAVKLERQICCELETNPSKVLDIDPKDLELIWSLNAVSETTEKLRALIVETWCSSGEPASINAGFLKVAPGLGGQMLKRLLEERRTQHRAPRNNSSFASMSASTDWDAHSRPRSGQPTPPTPPVVSIPRTVSRAIPSSGSGAASGTSTPSGPDTTSKPMFNMSAWK